MRAHFKLTPRGIIESLDLRRPIYKKTAAFGHFGRTEPEFTWERTDKAAALRADARWRAEWGLKIDDWRLAIGTTMAWRMKRGNLQSQSSVNRRHP